MKISAVIPVLDEAAEVGACLAAVRALPGDWETVVVDGGSRDDTLACARAAGASQVIVTEPGRGGQLRAGAEAAQGEALVFLHADARLPADAAHWIEDTVTDLRWSGGAFRARHRASARASFLVRRLLPLADLRSRYTSLPYGDQAVFTSRRIYKEVGGVHALPLMEDLDFSRRLRATAPIRLVPAVVEASGRRFEAAPVRTFFCWMFFPTLYSLGVPPERLARWYGSGRGTGD